MSRENIKLRIRDIMAQKGLTNKALADKIGVKPVYTSNVLNGRDLSLNILAKIADALEVEFGDLFISSFTPQSQYEDEFMALVKCRRGTFTASSVDELQDVVNTLNNRSANAVEMTKRTLERFLRFPDGTDMAFVSELMANLSRCMNPDDWRRYYKETLTELLPPTFQFDFKHLSTFMTSDEVLALERSIL